MREQPVAPTQEQMEWACAERRLRIYALPEHEIVFFLNAVRPGARFVSVPYFRDLPFGYLVVSVFHDWTRRAIMVMVAHPDFARVPEGEIVPCDLRALAVSRVPAADSPEWLNAKMERLVAVSDDMKMKRDADKKINFREFT